ncbi:hypothetical protein [Longimicrobium sp.]|uniref:hypothetical protein n=1 Tax=Longimicrobium sp. TaxID=2029185 RepID=UPI002C1EA979|nr:hypothetical protein [Longimicrobium sp.]HSU12861.1 hypothetical protein [Longimicrobium sp.]
MSRLESLSSDLFQPLDAGQQASVQGGMAAPTQLIRGANTFLSDGTVVMDYDISPDDDSAPAEPIGTLGA